MNLVEDEQDYENMLNDMSGHGSAVASIISSIDPDAEIYSVRVLDKDNKGTLSRIVSGIYWCIENDVDIINMSFGSDNDSEILKKAIEDAKEHGILMVSAAGNDPDKGVQYPARLNDVISVGSVDSNGEMSEENADGDMDVTAPGEDVFTQSALGLYTVVSGTSMAAPHVAAAASLLWKEDRDKPAEFIAGLISGSENKTNNDSGDDAGIVDVDYAREVYDEYENDVEKIPQNDSEVVTFADGEVNASWGESGHKGAVDFALRSDMLGTSYLTTEQKNILKNGAVYPDKGELSHEVYHGRRSKNWLASYKYITAVGQSMAKSNNSTLSYPSLEAVFPYAAPKDINSTHFKAIKSIVTSDIRVEKVRYKNSGWLNWSDSLILNGASQTAKNKSMFIYGLALHDLTDTFAHATYITEYSKTLKKVVLKPIVHKDSIDKPENASSKSKFIKKGGYVFEAHDPETPKGARNRWRDAAYGTKELVKRAKSADVGNISDFAPNDYRDKGKSEGRGYYLDEPINKALKIKASSTWSKMFEGVDCIY